MTHAIFNVSTDEFFTGFDPLPQWTQDKDKALVFTGWSEASHTCDYLGDEFGIACLPVNLENKQL